MTSLLTHAWAYPLLEVTHIAGIAMLFGSLVVLDVRLWGAGAATLPAGPLARLVLRVTWVGFALVLASGGLMFSTQPGELLHNPAFRVKLVLLVLAGLNAAWFHLRGGLARDDRLMRALGALSLGIWLGVMICGRWIAYA
ncbi:hypothetical protein [Rhizobacter sp. Root1221]|uniref:hypothetical protein n=1 Tax=Rhizobacter sp. Root1221 TaxID=1736433 RepID=UPI0006FEC6F5|nr:hypothetical protein [Rhizobacter sp. Root1221]KQW01386.1 hypothetical protein ASC87_16065 [Rhizobacter sp. Root1221]